jgi:hypothetical protein
MDGGRLRTQGVGEVVGLTLVVVAGDHRGPVQRAVRAYLHSSGLRASGLVGLQTQNKVGEEHLGLAVNLHPHWHVHIRTPGYVRATYQVGIECANHVVDGESGREVGRAVVVPIRCAVIAHVQGQV